MTPAEYVTEIVAPTLRECKDERQSRRRAYLACITVFHVKDHLKEAGETKVQDTLEKFGCQHYEAVRGFCDGAKHAELKRPHEVPFPSGADFWRPPAIASVMVVGLSALGDSYGGREFQHGDERFDLYFSARSLLIDYRNCYPHHLSSCDLHDV